MKNNDTIFALSTVPGKAGIAIVRLTGPESLTVVEKLTGSTPAYRKAVLRELRYDGETVDTAIVICSALGSSYTGEEMVEFHIHGSLAIVKSLIEVLGDRLGLRNAEPGEFTKRALENDRLDLTQVEGLSNLLNAQTKAQKNQSLMLLSGRLGGKVSQWRERLLSSISLIEIMIDFSDQDVPRNTVQQVKDIVRVLKIELKLELNGYKKAAIIRDGYDVAIIGKPNVGKSSLLNFLAGTDKAIVSDQEGTTRDIIELSIDLNGYAVKFFDTAGLQDTEDEVEKIGIMKTRKRARDSNIRMFLLNPGDTIDDFKDISKKGDLFFCCKSDIQVYYPYDGISSKTGAGVKGMLEHIEKKLQNHASYSSVLTNERHRVAGKKTLRLMEAAERHLAMDNCQIEIVAEEIRSAIVEIDLLVGKISVEDMLGRIFSSFCIGK